MKNIMKKTLIFVLLALIAKPAYPVFGVSAAGSTLSRWGIGALSGVYNGAKNHPWLATGALVSTAAIAWCSYKYVNQWIDQCIDEYYAAKFRHYKGLAESLLKKSYESLDAKDRISYKIGGKLLITYREELKSINEKFIKEIKTINDVWNNDGTTLKYNLVLDDIINADYRFQKDLFTGFKEAIKPLIAIDDSLEKSKKFVELIEKAKKIIKVADDLQESYSGSFFVRMLRYRSATEDLEKVAKEIIFKKRVNH